MAARSGSRAKISGGSAGRGYGWGLIPVDRSMKGSGASGNSCRAAARSPPWISGSSCSGALWDRMSIAVTLLALLVEATLGYPEAVLRAIGHPVMWIGRFIGFLDRRLNRDSDSGARRKFEGFVALFLIVGGSAALAY